MKQQPIKFVIYPKQCKEYHEAVEAEDWFAANLWYMPPIHRRWADIESDMRFNELIANQEAETKRIDSMTNEELHLEIEMKYPEPKVKRTKPSFLSWLFS